MRGGAKDFAFAPRKWTFIAVLQCLRCHLLLVSLLLLLRLVVVVVVVFLPL